jgi:hypothetical protein
MRTFLYRLKERAKNALKKPVDDMKLFDEGFAEFKKSGKTPVESYFAFVRLYCKTNGKLFEIKHNELAKNNPPKKQEGALTGVIGAYHEKDFDTFNEKLNKDGYVGFEKKISPELIKKLTDFALKTHATTAPAYDKKIIYDASNPVSEIYRFAQQDLVNDPDIQDLMMDEVFINIARKYLGCEPIFDFPAMWWSTAFLKEASAEAAQLYHFDLDRLKWCKNIYLLN